MIFDSLGSRQKSYEEPYDLKLTRRLPIIVRVNGRSFRRLTKNLEKPYSFDFLRVMAQTMFYAAAEMQGAVLAYQQSDEISYVLKNDQELDSEPWYQNRLQKIVSVASSLTTIGFYKALNSLEVALPLVGDAVFDARVFCLPYFTEVVNNLIWRQQDCTKNAILKASQAEMIKKYGKQVTAKILHQKSLSEKKDLLFENCGIDFDDYYPASFRQGVVASKVPTIIPVKDGTVTRNKWALNWDIPNFIEDKDYLFNILLNGHDVFRSSSFLK